MLRKGSVRRTKRTIGNAYFESLFNKVREAITLCDNRGVVIRVNEEFRRMFGYTSAEAQGRSIDDLVAPEGLRPDAADLTRTAAKGESFATEGLRQRKDGSRLQVSILGAPILVHGRQVAVYGIYRDITGQKAAERALLDSQAQVLEANAVLQQRTRELEEANLMLERLSNLDGLTAIPNRRYFEEHFPVEWRRAHREESWISVIMVDVDLFKSYNDRYGHLAGDECLKAIAGSLAEGNRAGDLVARFGGEEFVALLTSSSLEGALLVAERMRQRIEDLAIPHGGSTISPYVTVSLGVASQNAGTGAGPVELLRRADRALYQAKTRGRNRVETDQEPPGTPLFTEV